MKNLLVSLILLIITISTSAQQEALFSQYMFNKLAINPGYAGSREIMSADIVYRYQWVNIDGAPQTLNASLHSPLTNPHLALGFNVYNDRIGPMNYTGVMGTFAYKLLFPKSKLSFGVSGGFKNNGIIFNEFNVKDKDDPFLIYGLEKKIVPDANFGIYYSTNKFYAGVSTHQLLQNQTLVSESPTGTSFSKLVLHYYIITGLVVPIGDNVMFRPSLLTKFTKNVPSQVDINASFLFSNTLWLGVSYRTEKALSFITEINISQNMRVGYSYDIWLNELKIYNKGSHELRLSFEINLQKRMLSPRYF